MKYTNNVNTIVVSSILILSSVLISYTYYFDHLAIVNTLVLFNNEIYQDKSNLFFLIQSNSPSFLFIIINFLIKIGFSVNLLNMSLTFLATLLNLSGIYLICKFITSSIFLSILISITAIFLTKNLGDIDYPALMFSWHSVGLLAYSLSTFILGLLTLRNLLFAFLTCLFLLAIHLTVGLWMLGIISLSSFFFIKKKNIKKIGFTIFIFVIVVLFYLYWFTNYSADLPFEFNKYDYDDYFKQIEAHRTNYGDLGNLYLNYLLKSLILLTLILFFINFNFSSIENNNNFFFKTLSISIIFSGIIFLTYKIFPQIFPEIVIRTIPQRFFLIHSVVGYPIIISIIYKILERFMINKKIPFVIIVFVIILHLIQQNEVFQKRFTNIENINKDKITEDLFWKKVKNLELDGYVLTSNNLCNKTIIYGNLPILFCFDALDIIPLIPKLASPIKEITDKILNIAYEDLRYKNLGGISEIEVNNIYENKKFLDWYNLKKNFNLNFIIVPKNLNLDLTLILDDKYRVYKIE